MNTSLRPRGREEALLAVLLLLTIGAAPGRAEHSHAAPHGGTLIALGDHFAHLELKVDPARGELRIWVLDGEAAGAIRVRGGALDLKVRHLEDSAGRSLGEESVALTAQGVGNPLTGESAAYTSEFTVRHPALKGAARFGGLLREVVVKGVPVRALRLRYPEGNEGEGEDHEHAHD